MRSGTVGKPSYQLHHVQVWDVGENSTLVHSTVEAPGHRAGIRTVALSGDDALLLSAAAEGVKLWNAASGVCVRSMQEPAHGLCALFAPGGRHAIIGSKVDIFCLTACPPAGVCAACVQLYYPTLCLCSSDSPPCWSMQPYHLKRAAYRRDHTACTLKQRLGVQL